MKIYVQKIGLIVLLLLSFGCKKEDTGIPNVYIDFRMPIGDPRLIALSAPMGTVFLEGYGVAGIVIYNTGFGSTSLVAFDRCSTVNPEKRCAVILDEETGLNLIDPCSGAKFDLTNGFPTKAPAKKALKRYRVSLVGGLLQITN